MRKRPLRQNRTLSRLSLCLALTGGASLFLAVQPGRAADRTWSGAAGDNQWGTGTNWNVAPSITGNDGLRFRGAVATSATNNLTNAIFNKLVFDSGAAAFVLSGNAIKLNHASNGIRNLGDAEQTINLNIELADDSVATNFGASGTGVLTMNGILSGVGRITILAGGQTKLNAANTFSGGLAVGSGQVRLGHAQAAGTGRLNFSTGGKLTFAAGIGEFSAGSLFGTGAMALTDELGQGIVFTVTGAAEVSKDAALTGNGGLKVALQSGGKQTLSAANTYTGGTTVESGTLELSGPAGNLASTGALTMNGGTLLLSRSGGTKILTVSSFSGTGGEVVGNTTTSDGVASDSTLVVNSAANGQFDGVLRDGLGTLSLTKSGAGVLTLGGTSTHTGATTVNGGVLNVDGALTASHVVVGGGTLGGNGGSIENSVTINTGGAMGFTLLDPSTTNLTVGSLLLSSDVDLKLTLGSAVQVNDSFTILGIAGDFQGTFATVNGVNFGEGGKFTLQYGVDTYDFAITYGTDAVNVTVVPEPQTVMMLSLACGVLLLGRNRRTLIGMLRRI